MKKLIILAVCVLVIAAAAITLLIFSQHETRHEVTHDGKYTYIYGTVTAYDTGPTANDGNIVFKIDDKAINIGGGWPSSGEMGEVYTDAQVGDKVQAKVVTSKYNYLTVFDCGECYIKKQ